MFFSSRSATPELTSGASTPSYSSNPPSPRLLMEKWIVDVEDLQDHLAALSVASSTTSATHGFFDSVFSGLTSSKNKLLNLANAANPLAFEFTFPSLENDFPS